MPKPASYVQPIHFEDFDGAQFERLVFAYHARAGAGDHWSGMARRGAILDGISGASVTTVSPFVSSASIAKA